MGQRTSRRRRSRSPATVGIGCDDARQTIRGTATDSGTGGSGISALRVNGQSAKGGTVSASKTANWSQTITLSSGSNTITVDAVDGAGNIQMQQFTLLLGVRARRPTQAAVAVDEWRHEQRTADYHRSDEQPVESAERRDVYHFFTGATGGRGPYQFKWIVLEDITWTVVRDWSP